MMKIVHRIGAALVLLAGLLVILYLARNPERESLDDSVRSRIGGAFVRLSVGTVHYELTGPESAPVVVLLHSGTVPMYLWDRTVPALRMAGYRVLRFDLFGRGLSDRPDVAYTRAFYDNQVFELLDSLHIRGSIDLVGVSIGAVIGVTFAARHAAAVRSLTLISPGFDYMPEPPFLLGVPFVGDYLMRVLGTPSMPERQRIDFSSPIAADEYIARYREQLRYHGFTRAVSSMMRGDLLRVSATEFRDLGKSDLPVLVVWGREDRTTPYAQNADVRAVFLRAKFAAIDSAGHVSQYERPEAVNEQLVAFLRGVHAGLK